MPRHQFLKFCFLTQDYIYLLHIVTLGVIGVELSFSSQRICVDLPLTPLSPLLSQLLLYLFWDFRNATFCTVVSLSDDLYTDQKNIMNIALNAANIHLGKCLPINISKSYAWYLYGNIEMTLMH